MQAFSQGISCWHAYAHMTIIIFELAVLIFSVIVHEVAHGAVAYRLGDDTAHRSGRLTLNPIPHIDPFGSIILPALLALPALVGVTPIIVGWAKPVPYDPHMLKNPKRDAGLIALAGPASNITLALIFAFFLSVFPEYGVLDDAFKLIILINLMLAIFNLVPIPPLDGSKILGIFLPVRSQAMAFLERHSMTLLLIFIFFGLGFVDAIVRALYAGLMVLAGI